jgi:hypothetical protein
LGLKFRSPRALRVMFFGRLLQSREDSQKTHDFIRPDLTFGLK